MLTFWEKGYRRTSLDDLVERTGASRASLYKTFGDKRDIFIKSLDLYASAFEKRARDVLAEDLSMLETARTLLGASAERLSNSKAPAGCLRCNSTLELMGSETALDRALEKANRGYHRVMEQVAQRGVDTGEIHPLRKAAMALFLTGVVAGMVTLARSGAGRDDLFSFMETSLTALKTP